MIPKFRVWDSITNKIFPVEIIDFSVRSVYLEEAPNEFSGERSFDEVVFLQFTALKDKTGKEIFEGDIVKYKLGRNTFYGEVTYNDKIGCFGLYNKHDDSNLLFDTILGEMLEVVGNVYENPKLIDEWVNSLKN